MILRYTAEYPRTFGTPPSIEGKLRAKKRMRSAVPPRFLTAVESVPCYDAEDRRQAILAGLIFTVLPTPATHSIWTVLIQ